MGERRRVHDDASHQRGGEPAIVGVERHPEADRQQRHHLARGGRRRVDPVGRTDTVIGGVVVDDDPRHASKSSACRAPTSPTRSSEPQSEMTTRS